MSARSVSQASRASGRTGMRSRPEATSDQTGSNLGVHTTSTKGEAQMNGGPLTPGPLSPGGARGSGILAPGIAKVLDPNGATTTTRVADYFGVTRYSSSPLSPDLTRYEYGAEDDEGFVRTLQGTQQKPVRPRPRHPWKPPYTRAECEHLVDGWLNGCSQKLTACLVIAGIPVTVATLCLIACINPDPWPSRAVCIACLMVEAGALAAALACFKAYNQCRADAGAWRNQCYAKASLVD